MLDVHTFNFPWQQQEQNAIQGRKQKGVHNGSEAPVATAARASVVPSVPFAKSAAPAPNNQLCGWARCTLTRSDGGQHCTGHTCKTPGCTSGKTPSSPFCRSCEVAIRQQSRPTPTSGSSASARPVAVAVPEWAEKHRKEWDMLEGQRGRVRALLIAFDWSRGEQIVCVLFLTTAVLVHLAGCAGDRHDGSSVRINHEEQRSKCGSAPRSRQSQHAATHHRL